MKISHRFAGETMNFYNCQVTAHYRRINGTEYRFSVSTVWDGGMPLATSYLVTKWVEGEIEIPHSLTKDHATGKVYTGKCTHDV